MHVCALLSDATVTCWVLNFKGQLGTPSPPQPPPSPRPTPGICPSTEHGPIVIPALSNVVQIAGGDSHTRALLSDGTVSCWGFNTYGQLGDGTNDDHLEPAVTPNLGHVAQIALDYMQSCAVLDDGTLECWGATAPQSNSVPVTNTPPPVSFP
jgi:alpha-tubulin suppressor-like RCC1 family protein